MDHMPRVALDGEGWECGVSCRRRIPHADTRNHRKVRSIALASRQVRSRRSNAPKSCCRALGSVPACVNADDCAVSRLCAAWGPNKRGSWCVNPNEQPYRKPNRKRNSSETSSTSLPHCPSSCRILCIFCAHAAYESRGTLGLDWGGWDKQVELADFMTHRTLALFWFIHTMRHLQFFKEHYRAH